MSQQITGNLALEVERLCADGLSEEEAVEDTVPEDTSLVFDTAQGLVVLSGCGHAGLANTLEYARRAVREAPVYAALGGRHPRLPA